MAANLAGFDEKEMSPVLDELYPRGDPIGTPGTLLRGKRIRMKQLVFRLIY